MEDGQQLANKDELKTYAHLVIDICPIRSILKVGIEHMHINFNGRSKKCQEETEQVQWGKVL